MALRQFQPETLHRFRCAGYCRCALHWGIVIYHDNFGLAHLTSSYLGPNDVRVQQGIYRNKVYDNAGFGIVNFAVDKGL